MKHSQRKFIVFTSLIGVLTVTSALLLALAPAPVSPDAASSLYAIDAPSSLDVIFETKALSKAMVAFGHCLDGTEKCAESDLNDRALAVSSAIQVAIEQHAALRVSEFSKDKFQY